MTDVALVPWPIVMRPEPCQVATAQLHVGDEVVTADLIRASVTVVDGREPWNGTWVECVTEEGLTLRFAASARLTVTRLKAGSSSYCRTSPQPGGAPLARPARMPL